MPTFEGFPKIPRLFRDVVITEKIDGTNASVVIVPAPGPSDTIDNMLDWEHENGVPLLYTYMGEARAAIYAGSRKRFITPKNDNFGFAQWVFDHAAELTNGLGFGTHYGEWWGQGIQRGYGLKEKRFSLFNVAKWDTPERPACCSVVPVIYKGVFDTEIIKLLRHQLEECGSYAAPGYMDPEGMVIFHTRANCLFKMTLKNDHQSKEEANG